MSRRALKRQREEQEELQNPKKKPKLAKKIFKDYTFILNEEDQELEELLTNLGAEKVTTFSYYGGYEGECVYIQVAPLSWQQMCYAAQGTSFFWVKKEFVLDSAAQSKLLSPEDYTSFSPGPLSASNPWYVELSDKKEENKVIDTIKANGGTVISLPFFAKATIISDQETVAKSSQIYNYVKYSDDEEPVLIQTPDVINKILSDEIKVWEVESHTDTAIEYNGEDINIDLEENSSFSRFPFRMQRYERKYKHSMPQEKNLIAGLPDETWIHILSFLSNSSEVLKFASTSNTAYNIATNDAIWLKRCQNVQATAIWAPKKLDLVNLKPASISWFDFFKTRVHPLILDEKWFNRAKRNSEYEEELEIDEKFFKIAAQMDFKRINQKNIAMGQSQVGGIPHFPKSLEWPENQQFILQINLEELVSDLTFALHGFPFPKKGIVYYFWNANSEASILYYKGQTSELSLRSAPEGIQVFPARSVKFFETLSVASSNENITDRVLEEYFAHRAVKADQSIFGWDMPTDDTSYLVNESEDNDEDEDNDGEENSDENSDANPKHNKLLLCLHSLYDMKFGESEFGGVIFWLPYAHVPKNPETSDPSQWEFGHT